MSLQEGLTRRPEQEPPPLKHLVIATEPQVTPWTTSRVESAAILAVLIWYYAAQRNIPYITLSIPGLSEEHTKLFNEYLPGSDLFETAQPLPEFQLKTTTGREDLVEVVRGFVGKTKPEDITGDLITERISNEFPPPDFKILTGQPHPDAVQLRGDMVWESAYADFAATDTPFLDLTPELVSRLIRNYNPKNRRFGGLPEESVLQKT